MEPIIICDMDRGEEKKSVPRIEEIKNDCVEIEQKKSTACTTDLNRYKLFEER